MQTVLGSVGGALGVAAGVALAGCLIALAFLPSRDNSRAHHDNGA